MTQITFSWEVKFYDIAGNAIALVDKDANPISSFDGLVDQSLSFPLNGIDTFSASAYLDNPNANKIVELATVVKVWRHISGDFTYDDPSGTPCFAGPITRVEKDGESNIVSFLAQSPYWRLQSRFHRNNWKLVIDYAGQNLSHGWDGGNMDGLKWDVSALCWRLIDLVNHQLGDTNAALTGIVKPTGSAPFWTKTLTIHGGRNVRRGTWVWDEITEMMGQYEDGNPAPDLVPEYINNGTYALMYFKTSPHRGTNKSATLKFEYCTGQANLQNLNEVTEVVPNQNFANYVWTVGNNDPETRRKQHPASGIFTEGGDYSINSIGNYMRLVESDSDDMKSNGLLQNLADAEFKKLCRKPVAYAIVQAPLKAPFYGLHYGVGDLAMLSANKGALVVTNVIQRIYEVNLSLSDNCVETANLRIADDHFAKVPLV